MARRGVEDPHGEPEVLHYLEDEHVPILEGERLDAVLPSVAGEEVPSVVAVQIDQERDACSRLPNARLLRKLNRRRLDESRR